VENTDAWSLVTRDGSIEIRKRQGVGIQNSVLQELPAALYCCTGTLPVPLGWMVDEMYEPHLAKPRRSFMEVLQRVESLHCSDQLHTDVQHKLHTYGSTAQSQAFVLYEHDKVPWPVLDRESVFLYVKQYQADGTVLLVQESVGHKDYPARNDMVRVKKRVVTRLEPWRDSEGLLLGCQFQALSAMDIGLPGQVPDWVVDFFVATSIKYFQNLAADGRDLELSSSYNDGRHAADRPRTRCTPQKSRPVQDESHSRGKQLLSRDKDTAALMRRRCANIGARRMGSLPRAPFSGCESATVPPAPVEYHKTRQDECSTCDGDFLGFCSVFAALS